MDTSHAEKIKQAGIRRFGSEEAWRAFLRESSAKSRRNHLGTGYFSQLKKTDLAKLKELSKLGGLRGKTK